MKIKVELEQEKDIWGVQTNTDLTEGRGRQYFSHLCEKESTALRLAKKNFVQGSDSPIRKLTAYKIGGIWLYQGANIEQPTEADNHMERNLIEERIRKDAKKKVLAKAKELGLSDEDIKLLSDGVK